MENATKALLIAASVLIAILIISLGLVVYNKAAESMDTSIMSDTEIASFNGKFLAYEGTSVSGSTVNALIRTVLQNNMSQTDAGKKVSVSGAATLKTSDTSMPTGVDTGATYTVSCTYNSKTGLVTSITVTKKT